MKQRIMDWLKVALLAPLATSYASGGCTANALRDTAEVLDGAADDLDGDENDVDLGDWLSEELEDL